MDVGVGVVERGRGSRRIEETALWRASHFTACGQSVSFDTSRVNLVVLSAMAVGIWSWMVLVFCMAVSSSLADSNIEEYDGDYSDRSVPEYIDFATQDIATIKRLLENFNKRVREQERPSLGMYNPFTPRYARKRNACIGAHGLSFKCDNNRVSNLVHVGSGTPGRRRRSIAAEPN